MVFVSAPGLDLHRAPHTISVVDNKIAEHEFSRIATRLSQFCYTFSVIYMYFSSKSLVMYSNIILGKSTPYLF